MVKEIHNEEDLDKLRELEGDFILRDDIEISGDWEPIGDESDPFEGTLDGRWHTISGVDVDVDYYGGFFSEIGDSLVKNLALTDVDVHSTGDYVGGLVGSSAGSNSVIESVYVSGNVEGETSPGNDYADYFVGGIAGIEFGECVIRGSVFEGDVYGGDEAGGIVGRTSNNSEVHNCLATGSVTGDFGDYGGGIVGSMEEWQPGWPTDYSNSKILGAVSAVDVDGYTEEEDMITGYYETGVGDVLEGTYYNTDIGWSIIGTGLTTEEIQGMDSPPEHMDYLHFSEGRNEGWVTREDDYPAPAQVPTEVIEIYNQEGLNQLRELAGFFVLRNNVLIDGEWEPVGDVDNPFLGSLDGDYNVIFSVSANAYPADSYNAGFFSDIYKSEIRNLVLEDVDVYADEKYAGGLVGFSGKEWNESDNTIENVRVTGEVEVEDSTGFDVAGGIVGGNGEGSVIRKSSFEGVVYGVDEAGGIVGRTIGDTLINNCYAEGKVTGVGSGAGGGIVGRLTQEPEEIAELISIMEVDGFSQSDMILGSSIIIYHPEAYYNEELGSSDYGNGLTTEQMQGTENPPEFMGTLDFSEGGVWTTREDDYPIFRWLESVDMELPDIPEDVLRILRGGYSSERLSVGRKFHGHGRGTSMRM